MKAWSKIARAALALITVALCLELASTFVAESFQLTSELLVLLALWELCPSGRQLGRRALRLTLMAAVVVLVVCQLDRQAFLRWMGDEPLLYDQLFMLRHLLVLIGDVWRAALPIVLGSVLAIAAVTWSVRRLLREAKPAWPLRERASVAACVLLLALVRDVWASPNLHDNWTRSRALYASVQAQITDSPYRAYADLQLQRRPDVYLFFVESYGRVLAEHPALRDRYAATLARVQARLEAAGFASVSAYSRAPVMGGRSWLATGSVLMGTHVAYETTFHHLIGQIDHVPNLVGFLGDHGYETILVAPSDRKRPGVEEVNYYHHQRCIRFHELAYRGPRYGWGIVPDQFSLGWLSQQLTAAEEPRKPRYVELHLVSSHAPWQAIPKVVSDWRSLSDAVPQPALPIDDSVGSRLQRYADKRERFPDEGALDDDMGQRYLDSIVYDFTVISDFVRGLQGDALVVLMGDHQPPFISAETRNFDTPVHVLARDPSLLRELARQGFSSGLSLDPHAPAVTRHEALFSLLVRALSRCCARSRQLPSYDPPGVRIGS
jgi:hypothetical protein